MSKARVRADESVDGLYHGLRGRHGGKSSRANGYLYEGYFRGEQALLLKLLNPRASIIVDIACGSGLMLLPIRHRDQTVIGLDFNREACAHARENGLMVVRADAFTLPFADASVDELINCQFFNQQPAAAVAQLVAECARVLRPGGNAIFVWRNGPAWVHRLARGCLAGLNRIRGHADFPYEDHSLERVSSYGAEHGLSVVRRAVSFPPLRWCTDDVGSFSARLIGASNICILTRPQ